MESNPQQEQVNESIRFSVDRTQLTKVFESVNTLVDDVTVEVTTEGLTVRTMDPSHVALVDIEVPQCEFVNGTIAGTGKFGVRVDEFVKILKQFKPVDKLETEFINVEIADNRVVIKKETFDGKITATVRTIESYNNNTPLPKITFNAQVEVPTTKLLRQIESLNVVSEYVTLKAVQDEYRSSTDALSLSGKGDYAEQTNQIAVQHSKVSEDSETTYSIDYIKRILRVLKFADNVKVNFSTKMPLRIDADLGVGKIHFYLAPRIQD